MSTQDARALSNNFQDLRLVSLSAWSKASEIIPRDANGPYVVMQEGYDPGDPTMLPDEFLLGRSGRWLSLGLFYRLPVEDRRAEFVFGTAAEVMTVVGNLPSKPKFFGPSEQPPAPAEASPKDDLSEALEARKGTRS